MGIVNFAQESFRSDGDQFLVPRQKYNFTLILDYFDRRSSVFTRVSSTTAPGYSVDTTVMNQYNKKRVVQTRLNYEPVTVSFYDTIDNEWHALMKEYLAHYYNGENGINQRTGTEGASTVDPDFVTSAGYTPNSNKYFFPSIRIIQNGHRNRYRETILRQPHIVNIQGDTLDYSDSQAVMYTVTFQPESVETGEKTGIAPHIGNT